MAKTSINITIRKDGRYMGKFLIGYAEDGHAQYQYVYGRTYEEAEQKVLIGQEIAARFLSGRMVTVSAAYAEWIQFMRNRVKESSLASYQAKFEKHILPAFGDMLCDTLTATQINQFINAKIESGLSTGYVRDIISVFKSMLRYAQEEHSFRLSLKNVMLPKQEKRKTQKISDAEIRQLVSYLKAHPTLTTFGILISAFMGLRIGELCGLQWEDVDLSHRVLHIKRTVQRICCANGDKRTKIVISSPKSDTSYRTIAIPDALLRYFEMFRGAENCYILSGTERPIEPRTMQYRYQKMLQSAGISHHNYHKLRHTFATNCAEKGFDVKTLSMVLGHSSVSFTLNRYVHPDRLHERKMMNCLRL